VATDYGTTMPSKSWEESIPSIKLPARTVTGRACARPAPMRPATYGGRWADYSEEPLCES